MKIMKNFGLLSLGLLCGAMLPLSTWAIENGIYTVERGHKTVIWSGTILTVAQSNLSGTYFWGFNENTSNSTWVGNYADPGTGTYYSGGRMYGNTTTVNNAWGGGDDTLENGYNSGLNPERQGPCETGWHVPSRGEWNSLVIAWCNLDEQCNPITDLQDTGEGNNLIKIEKCEIVSRFSDVFNIGFISWASSPVSYDQTAAWELYNDGCWLRPDNMGDRLNYDGVRCFKDILIVPQTFSFSFFNDGEHVWSGDIVSGSQISMEIISQYNLTGLNKIGYIFSGWVISGSDAMFDVENDVVTTGMTLNALRTPTEYTITYELDGGTNSENNVTGYTIETPDITLENPTKDGYSFEGWFSDAEFTTGVTTIPTGTTGDITLYARWTEIKKPSGGSSGGGGRSNKTSNDSEKTSETWDEVDTSDNASQGQETSDGDEKGNDTEGFSDEFQQAYQFAHENGITTMDTIQEADMEGKLTRIAMAKMLSQYAMNVLGQKPANIVVPNFNDITEKLDADYDNGVTLAYQLGIMGINMPDNKFRPNDEVTRGEFATALSRMLYSTPDGKPYYLTHLAKLVKEKIITNNDPNMKELRGYVMIMLMRSAK